MAHLEMFTPPLEIEETKTETSKHVGIFHCSYDITLDIFFRFSCDYARDLVPDSALTTRLEVGGLSKEEARSLLRRCSGLDLQATLPPSADGIIKVCVCVFITILFTRCV